VDRLSHSKLVTYHCYLSQSTRNPKRSEFQLGNLLLMARS